MLQVWRRSYFGSNRCTMCYCCPWKHSGSSICFQTRPTCLNLQVTILEVLWCEIQRANFCIYCYFEIWPWISTYLYNPLLSLSWGQGKHEKRQVPFQDFSPHDTEEHNNRIHARLRETTDLVSWHFYLDFSTVHHSGLPRILLNMQSAHYYHLTFIDNIGKIFSWVLLETSIPFYFQMIRSIVVYNCYNGSSLTGCALQYYVTN